MKNEPAVDWDDDEIPVTRFRVKRVGDHEFDLPKQQSRGAAGFDLIATVERVIEPMQQVVIPTGFAWEIPFGFVGLIRDRSGIAVKARLTTRAGVIDCDYRGEVGVVLVNESKQPYVVQPGERVAQMIVIPYVGGVVEGSSALSSSERGDNGYGSTGK